MAAGPRSRIIKISDFLPPRMPPSDSTGDALRPGVENPPARHPRLLMRRFLVGSLYRHRAYWHARVQDLKTGKKFRMSSGERRKKDAEQRLELRLRVRETAEEIAALPEEPRTSALESAIRSMRGEDVSEARPLELEWVENEAYRRVMEGVSEIVRLAERGQSAVTPADLHQVVEQILAQKDPGKTGSVRGPVFLEAFGEFLQAKDVNAYTLSDYRRTGEFLARLIGERHVHEITGRDIQELLNRLRDGKIPDGRKRAQRTRQKQLTLLRDFFRWCRDVAKYVAEDPTVGLKIRVKKSQRKKIRSGLKPNAARRLLAALRVKGRQKNQDIQHVWLAVYIALRTGLRLGNVLRLRWFQVDLEQGTILIPAQEYKADRQADLVLPMHAELWRVLRLWRLLRKSSPLVQDENYVLGRRLEEIKNSFNAGVKRAGLDTDFHNLRHAFETWLVEADVPGAVQKSLMGHSPGSVTEGYAHPSLEKMRECVNRLPRLVGRHNGCGNESSE